MEIGKIVPVEWKELKGETMVTQKETVQDYNYQIIFTANTDEFQENEFMMTLNLEFDPKFQYFEDCSMIEEFKSHNESIIHNYLKKTAI